MAGGDVREGGSQTASLQGQWLIFRPHCSLSLGTAAFLGEAADELKGGRATPKYAPLACYVELQGG